jgi:hypothetical protein
VLAVVAVHFRRTGRGGNEDFDGVEREEVSLGSFQGGIVGFGKVVSEL